MVPRLQKFLYFRLFRCSAILQDCPGEKALPKKDNESEETVKRVLKLRKFYYG